MRGDASRGRKSFMFESKFCLTVNVKLFTKAAVFPWSRSGPGRVLVRLRPGRVAIGGAMVVGLAVRLLAHAVVR